MTHNNLSNSAERVQTFLQSQGVDLQVVELPGSTRTAADAASAVGCTVGQIVKSLVFRGKETGRPLLVLASGSNMVDEKRVALVTGEKIGKADAAFVRQHTGYAIGGIPPVGHVEKILTVMDEDLMQYSEIWAAAGTPHAVFKLTPSILRDLSESAVACIKRE